MRNQGIDKSKSYVKEKAPQRYQSLLTPNYELGCRRRILDRSYLQSLHDPKLLLVQDRIVSVGPKSVLTASGAEYPADFLVSPPIQCISL
jgi:cation diffusion facilitator CzcD-associated flavoprotein CzcO